MFCVFRRIVPPLAAIILLCTFILPEMGSGPQWNLTVSHHADKCKRNWWRNLLFVHNYFGFENMVSPNLTPGTPKSGFARYTWATVSFFHSVWLTPITWASILNFSSSHHFWCTSCSSGPCMAPACSLEWLLRQRWPVTPRPSRKTSVFLYIPEYREFYLGDNSVHPAGREMNVSVFVWFQGESDVRHRQLLLHHSIPQVNLLRHRYLFRFSSPTVREILSREIVVPKNRLDRHFDIPFLRSR